MMHAYRELVIGGVLVARSEEHTSELQSLRHLVCRLLLEKKHTYSHIFAALDHGWMKFTDLTILRPGIRRTNYQHENLHSPSSSLHSPGLTPLPHCRTYS